MIALQSPRKLPERAASLGDQVSDLIVEAISLGELRPGARVVEADVASRFEVSRVPVREAFKILATQGILEAQPHRGVRVAAVDDLTIERIREARLAIEILAIRALMADRDLLSSLGRGLDVSLSELADAVGSKDLAGVNRADIAFHTHVCRTSGNRIAFTLWQAIARHVVIVFGREILSETSLPAIVGQHDELARAILSGNEARAIATVRAHVLRLRGRAEARPGFRGGVDARAP